MRRRSGGVVLAAVVAALALAAPAQAAKDPLNAFRVKPTAENKKQLAEAGFDLTEGDRGSTSRSTRRASRRARSAPTASRPSRHEQQGAAAPGDYTGSDAAWDVWTRYDATSGDTKEQYEEQYDRVAADADRQEDQHRHDAPRAPDLGREGHEERRHRARQHEAGRALQRAAARPRVAGGRDLPAHARLLRRQLREDRPGASTTPATRSPASPPRRSPSSSTRASCGSSASPTRTATSTRSSPTTGCGARTWPTTTATAIRGEVEDGVDPNRNYATNWGHDNEGSSDDPTSETFRGTGPASEPETKAMHALWDRVDFVFQKNDHTAAELLLYPFGFQQYTATPDNAHLRGARRQRRRVGDRRQGVGRGRRDPWSSTTARSTRTRRSTASTPTSGPSSTSPTATRSTTRTTHGILGFTPEGSEPVDRQRLGLRVPGRRGRRRGRVPAPPAVLARPRALGRRSGEPVLAPRQHGRRLLRRRLRRVLRRSAERRGDRQALARRRAAALPHQRRQRAAGADEGGAGRRAVQQRRRASTSTGCAAR